ncbi:hypothetical protein ACTXT7_016903, partial [Hymenolepis weldensis]
MDIGLLSIVPLHMACSVQSTILTRVLLNVNASSEIASAIMHAREPDIDQTFQLGLALPNACFHNGVEIIEAL